MWCLVCQKGRFGAFLFCFFLFQRLNFRHAKWDEKVFGLQRMEKFPVVGLDWVSGTPVSALSPSQGCLLSQMIQILGML